VAALDPPPELAPLGYGELPLLLAGTFRAAAARDREPYLIVLTDSVENPAYWEHEWTAATLGVPLVLPSDLRLDGDRLMHGSHGVDGVYRRANDDTLDTDVAGCSHRPCSPARSASSTRSAAAPVLATFLAELQGLLHQRGEALAARAVASGRLPWLLIK